MMMLVQNKFSLHRVRLMVASCVYLKLHTLPTNGELYGLKRIETTLHDKHNKQERGSFTSLLTKPKVSRYTIAKNDYSL